MVARSWWGQAWRYRLATVQVTLVVTVVEIGLKLTDVGRLSRVLKVPLASDPAPPPAAGPDDLSCLTERERRIHWAVYWVMAQWLYDGTCLRRALTFGWFLRHRGPALRLGILNDGTTVAHAWIEVDGQAFNAKPLAGTFAALGGDALSKRALSSGTQVAP